MKEISIEENKQHIEELCENYITAGMKAVEELGSKLVEKAHKYEAYGIKLPINLFTIKTPFYSVQINYIGSEFGDTFVVLDIRDKYTGKPHGYPKTYFGNPTALLMGIISELRFVESMHEPDREED